MKELPYEQVAELIRLDPTTGKMYWRQRPLHMFKDLGKWKMWHTQYLGREALSTLDQSGYLHGKVLGVKFMAHRIVWLLHNGEWPKGFIDHIDGNKANNIPVNLRVVSIAENARNIKRSVRNWSGVSGVYWNVDKRRWCPTIKVDGKTKHLGSYRDFDLAVAARKEALVHYGYHENHGRG